MESKKKPQAPYYAVIFTNQRTDIDEGYDETAQRMVVLANGQQGFLGMESVRNSDGYGITVSYWDSLEAIRSWKENIEHREARRKGREKWYEHFKVRVCRVEREYGFGV